MPTTVAMVRALTPDGAKDARYPQRILADSSSSESLDIKDILAGYDCEYLPDLSLILPSISDETLSFDEVPPFPSDAKPPLYINVFDELPAEPQPQFNRFSTHERIKATLAAPIGSRVRVMLMEPIRAEQWVHTIQPTPAPGHVPWREDNYEDNEVYDFPLLPWKAEGSLYNPTDFHKRLASYHPERPPRGKEVYDYRSPLTPTDPAGQYKGDPHSCPNERVNASEHLVKALDNSQEVSIPTIMISNSTAIIPFSLESSQSLTRAPLAVRRGQKVPTPLTLNGPRLQDDPYPDVPTPFLGSPSSSSPSFDFASSTSAFSMGLEAMCADLRQRCPDFRAPSPTPPETPKEQEHAWHDVAGASPGVASPEDEWKFAQDLLVKYGDRHPPPLESPPPVPCGDTLTGTADLNFSWATSPTLIDSVEQSPVTPDMRQMRRKTVIIETPLQSRMQPIRAQAPSSQDDHDPLPFESPSRISFSCACQSTPASSRPSSSASMRPVKGILKEKKRVRFSMAPTSVECPSGVLHHDNKDADGAAQSSSGKLIRRSALSRPKSPLRQSFAATGSDVFQDSPTIVQEPVSVPKHPALRSITRNSARSPSPQTPAVTSMILADQQRAPLRSLNTHQSLPAKRNSNAVFVDQRKRSTVATSDIGRPKRLLKTASAQGHLQDENNASRRESSSRSRMPVPFRSILTKLRA